MTSTQNFGVLGTLLVLTPLAAPFSAPSAVGDLLAIRVGRAETGSSGTIEHAVILIEDGKFVAIGEDLPIERGIPVLDRPDWVATPGFVSCQSRIGMDSRAGGGFDPHARAADELYWRQRVYRKMAAAGITSMGLYPAGNGIPGQAVAIRPHGEGRDEMIVQDPAYLQVYLVSNAKSKEALRKAFEKVDEHEEKVEKARAKWEKAEEKRKKKAKSKKKKSDDDKDKALEKDEQKKDDGPTEFVPPQPDAKVQVFIDVEAKRLAALIQIRKAGDYLHLLDVIEDMDFDWHLRVPLRDDIDLYEVTEQIAERELVVVVEPVLTLQPNTRRMRNIPAELARAGAHLAFVPRSDTVSGHENWAKHVGELLRDGLERDVAVAAMTLNPARVLGLDERLGSLDEGKDANLVLWNGDPFQLGTQIQTVLIEGRLVFEEGE